MAYTQVNRCQPTPGVEPEKQECLFELVIREAPSNTAVINGHRYPITYSSSGQIFFRENNYYSAKILEAVTGLNYTQAIPAEKIESVIYGDGRMATADQVGSRLEDTVITINNLSPGPTLIVPENALITVRVRNEMKEKSTTVHWHGFDMRNAWFYDGSPTSQCPILPRMSFTYRFQATLPGNMWYHAHLGQQRADGLFGLFIVERNAWQKKKIAPFTADQIKPVMIHEHHPYSSDFETTEFGINTKSASLNYFQRYFRQDGTGMTSRHYETTMINGRGNFQMLGGKTSGFTALEVTQITGESDRLMIGGFGAAWSHEFQVEDHVMLIEEVDSNRIKPKKVDFLQVAPGERYLVRLQKIDPAADPKPFYVMRVDTVAVFKLTNQDIQAGLYKNELNAQDMKNTTGRTNYWLRDHYKLLTEKERLEKTAISLLTYQQDFQPDLEKFSEKFYADGYKMLSQQDSRCNENYTCKILNCNLKEGYDPKVRPFVKCIRQDKLISTEFEQDENFKNSKSENIIYDSVIMSFVGGGTINGYKFVHPLTPLTQTGSGNLIKTCDPNYRDECFYTKKYQLGQTVRLLILSGTEFGIDQPAHVFHMHGYKMKLLAEGFADVDPENKLSIDAYPDLEVEYKNQTSQGGLLVRAAKLAESFKQGKKSFNKRFIKNGISRDSWLVPSGGWKLVEVTFDNPGLFLAHCHMTTHNMGGMAMMFQVGDQMNFPLPNIDWPKCGDFIQGGGFSDFDKFQTYFEKFPREDVTEKKIELLKEFLKEHF